MHVNFVNGSKVQGRMSSEQGIGMIDFTVLPFQGQLACWRRQRMISQRLVHHKLFIWT